MRKSKKSKKQARKARAKTKKQQNIPAENPNLQKGKVGGTQPKKKLTVSKSPICTDFGDFFNLSETLVNKTKGEMELSTIKIPKLNQCKHRFYSWILYFYEIYFSQNPGKGSIIYQWFQ